jgi:glycosyltransferase involved in cell wall biosynthesis
MLKILDHAWHQVHFYRLHALPARFSILDIRPWVWKDEHRPRPDNFDGPVAPADVDGSYDLALCHLDQWVDRFPERGLPFRYMRNVAREHGLPLVCIMHGTPDSEENRRAVLELMDDVPVVCNSRQAAAEWDGGELRTARGGVPQFTPIIHGYDVDEFWSEPVRRRRRVVLSVCSGGSTSSWYHGTPLLERLKRDVPLEWLGPFGNRDWLPDYRSYREILASTLVYFSPTRRAPMPGARTEAMLAGCCVVTVPGTDFDEEICDTADGFVVETYREARDTLRWLLDHPLDAWDVGQAGREWAMEAFGKDRFVGDWLSYLGELGVT